MLVVRLPIGEWTESFLLLFDSLSLSLSLSLSRVFSDLIYWQKRGKSEMGKWVNEWKNFPESKRRENEQKEHLKEGRKKGKSSRALWPCTSRDQCGPRDVPDCAHGQRDIQCLELFIDTNLFRERERERERERKVFKRKHSLFPADTLCNIAFLSHSTCRIDHESEIKTRRLWNDRSMVRETITEKHTSNVDKWSESSAKCEYSPSPKRYNDWQKIRFWKKIN